MKEKAVEERFALIADNGDRLYPYKKSQVSTSRYGFALTSPGEQDKHGGGTYVDDIETVVKRLVFDGWSARVTTTNKTGPQRHGTFGIGKQVIVGYELNEELEPLVRSAITQPRTIIRKSLDDSTVAGEKVTSGKNGESKNAVDELTLQAIKTRRGQPKFRESLLAAYQGQCCVTGCAVQSVLEAAHITPHAQESDYKVTNGLLLRADIHTLYDLNHMGIDSEGVVHICTALRGSEYHSFEGAVIARSLPEELKENLANRFEGFNENMRDESP